MKKIIDEYLSSLKSVELEDKVDLIFYRPLGFFFAKLAQWGNISPSQVTILGMIAGIVSGYLFSKQTPTLTIIAIFLFLLSGILDSADGQLARISGKSSALGLVLDGLCDNIVFIAVYLGCISTIFPIYGHWIWLLAFPAGFSHSIQSSSLDYFLREYLFYTNSEQREDYANPDLHHARTSMKNAKNWQEKIFWKLRFSWIYQQQLICARSNSIRLKLNSFATQKNQTSFILNYKKWNKKSLYLWRPLGANIHTLGIIFFSCFGRFDFYLLFVDLIGLNLLLYLANKYQQHADKKFIQWCEEILN